MPLNGRLTWTEKLDEIQRRLAENTPADAAHTPGFDMPYFSRTEIELLLWEVSNAKLGAVPVEELGNVNIAGVTLLSGASPLAIPSGSIEIISATIDSAPCVEGSPAQYYWGLGEAKVKMFTLMKAAGLGARNIYHTGTTASAAVLKEPLLISWQNDLQLLPPGFDEECMREVVLLCQLQDYLPEGV